MLGFNLKNIKLMGYFDQWWLLKFCSTVKLCIGKLIFWQWQSFFTWKLLLKPVIKKFYSNKSNFWIILVYENIFSLLFKLLTLIYQSYRDTTENTCWWPENYDFWNVWPNGLFLLILQDICMYICICIDVSTYTSSYTHVCVRDCACVLVCMTCLKSFIRSVSWFSYIISYGVL